MCRAGSNALQLHALNMTSHMGQANLGILNHGKCGKEVDDYLTYFKPPYAPSTVFYEVACPCHQDLHTCMCLQAGSTGAYWERSLCTLGLLGHFHLPVQRYNVMTCFALHLLRNLAY